MNQEKIGNFIKDIRKKNNLTQAEFASLLGVTYQAVSKWENGKNIPDIATMREISNKFNVDISDLLDGKKTNKKINKIVFIPIVLLIIVSIICIVIFVHHHTETVNLNKLSTSCENFVIKGSAAYNKSKMSIYISNIDYCGKKDDTIYKEVKCNLYENYNDTLKFISSCKNASDITLNDFLDNLEISVDNYESVCKKPSSSSLYIELNATDENGKTVTYKIPITMSEKC